MRRVKEGLGVCVVNDLCRGFRLSTKLFLSLGGRILSARSSHARPTKNTMSSSFFVLFDEFADAWCFSGQSPFTPFSTETESESLRRHFDLRQARTLTCSMRGRGRGVRGWGAWPAWKCRFGDGFAWRVRVFDTSDPGFMPSPIVGCSFAPRIAENYGSEMLSM